MEITNNSFKVDLNPRAVTQPVVTPKETGTSTATDLVATQQSSSSGHQVAELKNQAQVAVYENVEMSEGLKNEANKTNDVVKNTTNLINYANVEAHTEYENVETPSKFSASLSNPDPPKQNAQIMDIALFLFQLPPRNLVIGQANSDFKPSPRTPSKLANQQPTAAPNGTQVHSQTKVTNEEKAFCNTIKNQMNEFIKGKNPNAALNETQNQFYSTLIDHVGNKQEATFIDAYKFNKNNSEHLESAVQHTAQLTVENVKHELVNNLMSVSSDLSNRVNFMSTGSRSGIGSIIQVQIATHTGVSLSKVNDLNSKTADQFAFVKPGDQSATTASYEREIIQQSMPQIQNHLLTHYDDLFNTPIGGQYASARNQLTNAQNLLEVENALIQIEVCRIIQNTSEYANI